MIRSSDINFDLVGRMLSYRQRQGLAVFLPTITTTYFVYYTVDIKSFYFFLRLR